jgi:hypothetical protein
MGARLICARTKALGTQAAHPAAVWVSAQPSVPQLFPLCPLAKFSEALLDLGVYSLVRSPGSALSDHAADMTSGDFRTLNGGGVGAGLCTFRSTTRKSSSSVR